MHKYIVRIKNNKIVDAFLIIYTSYIKFKLIWNLFSCPS
jgi:hypothetical protein